MPIPLAPFPQSAHQSRKHRNELVKPTTATKRPPISERRIYSMGKIYKKSKDQNALLQHRQSYAFDSDKLEKIEPWGANFEEKFEFGEKDWINF